MNSSIFQCTQMQFAHSRPVYTTLEFWYGTDKNGTGAIKKSSVHSFTLQFFPVPNNFISAFGTRTKLKCSFRFRLAESLLPSTHASCAVSKWRMESFRKSFSLISLKSGDSRTEKLEQLLNVSIRWLSLLSGCSHYQDYYKLHYI